MIEKENWLNNKCNAQSQLAAHEDPVVYTSMINSERKVSKIKDLKNGSNTPWARTEENRDQFLKARLS